MRPNAAVIPVTFTGKFAFHFAGYFLLSLGSLQAADGADAASVLHYSRVHQQQEAVLSSHNPWIWEIQGPHARIWIVGCLHLGTARDAAVFPVYLPYYHLASTLYFETPPGSANSYDLRRLVDRRGFLGDRETLAGRLSKTTWDEVRTGLASKPGELARISNMEPWMAAFTLAQDGYNRAGLRGDNSLESFMERSAIEDRKPIGGLEAPKDQILAMADAPLSDQEEFLRETVRGLDKLESQTQALRDAWLSGDLPRLQSVLGLSATPMRSGMHRNLIGVRNHRWVQKIREISEGEKNSLILVGVEHLVSTPYALPDLLEQAGFSIHRVDPRAKAARAP